MVITPFADKYGVNAHDQVLNGECPLRIRRIMIVAMSISGNAISHSADRFKCINIWLLRASNKHPHNRKADEHATSITL